MVFSIQPLITHPYLLYFAKKNVTFVLQKQPIMKIHILILTFLGLIFNAFSQTTLTHEQNALKPGDNNTFQAIDYVLPGGSGSNQIWDFSKIQYTGESDQGSVYDTPVKPLKGVLAFNLLVSEKEKEFYYRTTDNSLEELGYISEDFEVVYSDPVLKVIYPFSFGDAFSDQWKGDALFKGVTNIDLSGEHTVTADAFGTLILPDRVLKNTLRVKSEKHGIEVNMCGSTEVWLTRYLWYAPGYRYPVMYTSVKEYIITGQEPVVTKVSGVNLDQTVDILAEVDNGEQVTELNSDVSVIVYPNPFDERLTYNYFLRKDLSVSIDLYDISGRIDKSLLETQNQPEGLYTKALIATDHNLRPGIYYLRFTFDNKVIVKKIVKL